MKIAIPSKGKTLRDDLDPRFGRAEYFLIVDPETMQLTVVKVEHTAHGAGINSATAIVSAGANVLIAGSLGPNAFRVVKAAGVEIFLGVEGRIDGVIARYKRGELQPADDANCEGGMGGQAKN